MAATGKNTKEKRPAYSLSIRTRTGLAAILVYSIFTQFYYTWLLRRSNLVEQEDLDRHRHARGDDSQHHRGSASKCSGYDGVLHIRAGDRDAAAATIFFSYVVNHIIYAERHNLIPWIHFESVNRYTYTHSGEDTSVLMIERQRLPSGGTITRNQARLVQRNDGNLLLQEKGHGRVLWASGYSGPRGVYYSTLQPDCKLVTRMKNRTIAWKSRYSSKSRSGCLLSYNITEGIITIESRNSSNLQKSLIWHDALNHIPILSSTEKTKDEDYYVAAPLNLQIESKLAHPVPVVLRTNGSECFNNAKTSLLPIPGPPSLEDTRRTNISLTGHGIWRSYFENISSFDWNDESCSTLPLVQFPEGLVTSLHECDPHSVRSWVYHRLPQNLRPRNGEENAWLGSMREEASRIVKENYRLLPWLQSRIDGLVESFGGTDCLAMHIRHTDKGGARLRIPTQAFLPYADAYIDAGGKCIFLATDSEQAWSEIRRLWPQKVYRRMIVQEGAFRSGSDTATFVQADPSRINTEILQEIYAMAACSFFIHGFSAVSEAAIYLNPTLHNNSINLEIKDAPSPDEFKRVVSERLSPESPEKSGDAKLCFRHSMVPHDFMLKSNSFFPDPISSNCNTSDEGDTAEALSIDIHQRQSPISCNVSRQLYIDGQDLSFGFGSMINSWIKPFMYSLDNDYQFWSPGLGPFLSGKGDTLLHGISCVANSAACWFEEVSGCESAFREDRNSLLVSDSLIRRMDPRKEKDITAMYSLNHQGSDNDGLPAMIPLAYRKMGLFWYYSQILAYLLRPNYKFLRHLETTKKQMNWDAKGGPVISLHVRHGDSCTGSEPEKKSRRCDDLNTYMERVIPVAKRYGAKSIYLSTDNQEVIDNTSDYTEFTWMYQQLEKSSRSVIEWDSIKRSNVSTFALAQEVLLDIFLLAEGDIFIGKFTSNVDRIAYALMTFRKTSLSPYLSLDSPFCFDWGVKSGKSLYGEFDC
ncbi:hypothetical protein ACHAWF_008809 [Thalassiosira exigua]